MTGKAVKESGDHFLLHVVQVAQDCEELFILGTKVIIVQTNQKYLHQSRFHTRYLAERFNLGGLVFFNDILGENILISDF